MKLGLFVTGTDTGVGKTRVATALAAALLGAGYRVCPRKPVESGCELGSQGLRPADGSMLAAAAGVSDRIDQVTPFRLHAALSPERAARLEGIDYRIEDLVQACRDGVESGDFVLVEGAGGFYSPLAPDGGLNVDLARALGLPVMLVVADRLGCINHTLLSIAAIGQAGLELAGVVLNDMELAAEDGMNNLQDLQSRVDAPVVRFPYMGADAGQRLQSGWWRVLVDAPEPAEP